MKRKQNSTDKAPVPNSEPKKETPKAAQVLDLTLFKSNVPAVDGITHIAMGQKVKTRKGETPSQSEVMRIASRKDILASNPKFTPVQVDDTIRKAGKELKTKAAVLEAVANADDGLIVSSIRYGTKTFSPVYKRIEKEDLAEELMLATGKSLEECQAFLGVQKSIEIKA